MKKKKLMKIIDGLTADEEMYQAASADILQKVEGEKWYYGDRYKYRYASRAYFRMIDGLAVIPIFGTPELQLGSRKPLYILFLDRENGDFITYETLHNKWRQSVLDGLWEKPPQYTEAAIYLPPEDMAAIKEYCGEDSPELTAAEMVIRHFQSGIRKRQLEEKHKKETSIWDAAMEKVPELPKGWDNWVAKTAVTQHFIFFDYMKHVKEGFCTHCRRTVPVLKPRYNRKGRCPNCRAEIVYKSRGKAGTFPTKEEEAYLLQEYGDGKVVVRDFRVCTFYEKDSYENAVTHCYEKRRIIFDTETCQPFYYGNYKQQYNRWIGGVPSYNGWTNYPYPGPGKVYGRNLPVLYKGFLGKTGLREMLARNRKMEPADYLEYWQSFPYVEQLLKAGLTPLALEMYQRNIGLEWQESRKLAKSLGLDGQMLKQLRVHRGRIEYYSWLRAEKARGKSISHENVMWFLKNGIPANNISFIRDWMNPAQIRAYLQRQKKGSGTKTEQILWTWKDYLSMAEKLGMDTSDAIIFLPGNLFRRHDEAVLFLEARKAKERAAEVERQFPDLASVCRKIRKNYEYLEEDAYAMLVPQDAMDIIEEGRALHHCVGSGDRYFERICSGKSYILFLRRKTEIDVPFYTIEAEPDGKILQWHTAHNRQDKEPEEVKAFMDRWKKTVQKRRERPEETPGMERVGKVILEQSNQAVICGMSGESQPGRRSKKMPQEDLLEYAAAA